MSDDKGAMPEKEVIDQRKRDIKDTLCCPYCGERMRKWAVPKTLFTTWPNEYMYICFNDECPYMLQNYEAMARLGNDGSYRTMYDPVLDCCQPVPVLNKQALKEGIIDEAEEVEESEVHREAIIGTWKLISSRFSDEEDKVSYPLGQELQGILIYFDDGRMSVQNMPADGALFQAVDGSVVALETYGAYNGIFELQSSERIVHHIENSMFPDWAGRTQEREIAIDNNRLILTSPSMMVDGGVQIARMIWKRSD